MYVCTLILQVFLLNVTYGVLSYVNPFLPYITRICLTVRQQTSSVCRLRFLPNHVNEAWEKGERERERERERGERKREERGDSRGCRETRIKQH